MNIRRLSTTAAAVVLLAAVSARADKAKTYQVTGPVLEMTADSIAVKKGNDRWEIARDASTKMEGDVKVGSKVTIEYRMTATRVEARDAKAPAKAASKKTKK